MICLTSLEKVNVTAMQKTAFKGLTNQGGFICYFWYLSAQIWILCNWPKPHLDTVKTIEIPLIIVTRSRHITEILKTAWFHNPQLTYSHRKQHYICRVKNCCWCFLSKSFHPGSFWWFIHGFVFKQMCIDIYIYIQMLNKTFWTFPPPTTLCFFFQSFPEFYMQFYIPWHHLPIKIVK